MLNNLVVTDPEFRKTRWRLFARLERWLAGDDLLISYKFMRDVPAIGSPMAILLDEIREASRRYQYDEIEDGEWVFFQMIATGESPRLWPFGYEPSYEWRPKVYIPAGEDFESVIRQVRRRLLTEWPEIEASWTDRRWAEEINIDDLKRDVEWFYEVAIRRRRQDVVADEFCVEPRTVRRGMYIVRRLLGIRARQGRRPK